MALKDHIWNNWVGSARSIPAEIAEPKSNEELSAIIAQALGSGQRIRTVGSGHSWSQLTECGGSILLQLPEADQLLRVDKEGLRARVAGGMRLKTLARRLRDAGLSLPVLGSINQQAVAGALATSTHGTGRTFGSLSSLIEEIELIDGRGQTLRANHRKPDLFAAARCGLGTLGVTTEVTLRCEPAFRLEGVEEVMPLEETIASLDQLADNNQHFKMWWLPHTKKALIFRQNRAGSAQSSADLNAPNRGAIPRFFHDEIMRNAGPGVAMFLSSLIPPLVGPANRLLVGASPPHASFVDLSERVFSFPVRIHHWECEYAIGREHARKAINRIRRMIADRGFHIGFIVEMRFVKGDDIWLSPAYRRDSVYIGALQYGRLPHEPYFREFERIMDDYKGRPHWGKWHTKTAQELRNLYPAFKRFQEMRRRLDPKGIFLNDHLSTLLGVDTVPKKRQGRKVTPAKRKTRK